MEKKRMLKCLLAQRKRDWMSRQPCRIHLVLGVTILQSYLHLTSETDFRALLSYYYKVRYISVKREVVRFSCFFSTPFLSLFLCCRYWVPRQCYCILTPVFLVGWEYMRCGLVGWISICWETLFFGMGLQNQNVDRLSGAPGEREWVSLYLSTAIKSYLYHEYEWLE